MYIVLRISRRLIGRKTEIRDQGSEIRVGARVDGSGDRVCIDYALLMDNSTQGKTAE
jgi:hypothetical protein